MPLRPGVCFFWTKHVLPLCCVGRSVTASSIQLTFLAASLGQALVALLLGSQVLNTSLQLGEVDAAIALFHRGGN